MSRRRDGRGRPAHSTLIPPPAAGGGRHVIDNDTVVATARQLRLILDAIERSDCRVRLRVRRRGSRLPVKVKRRAQCVQNPQPLVRCNRRQFAHTRPGPRLASTPPALGSIK